MDSGIFQIVVTAVLSSILTMVFFALVYLVFIRKQVRQALEKIETIAQELEGRVAAGVRQGLVEGVTDIPKNKVKGTTQAVMGVGAGLVEGGISSLFSDKKQRPPGTHES